MTIPFLDFFKNKRAKGQPMAHVPMPAPTFERPSGERLSKTVLPNATRTVGPRDTFEAAAPSAPTASKRPYSLGGNPGGPRSLDLPPAVALAIEPTIERVIAMLLSEVVPLVPDGWIRPISEAEGSRRILLKAAEVEKGMSAGHPSVSIGSIYQQVPEIFVKPVPTADSTQVPLPFAKVMEGFKNVQQRSDQQRDQMVAQFETPFLKATLEDNTKFGIKTGPVQIHDNMPPVRMELATAETIAAAQPEAAMAQQFAMPLPPPPPLAPVPVQAKAPAPIEKEPPANSNPAPTRIPFKLSPTGPDAPASERVPASSGPSVPSGAQAAKIPFKINPPSDALREKDDSWLTTKERFEKEAEHAPTAAAPLTTPKGAAGAKKTEAKISLRLKPILQSLPPSQLTGDLKDLPEDVRFEVPYSLVESQLASGRVELRPEEFAAALPEAFRGFFNDKVAASVLLPLQDVLKNLSSASLRMRADQVEQEKAADFATPFSAKAEEDAKRFNLADAMELRPLKGMARQPATKGASAAPLEVLPSATQPVTPPEPAAIQNENGIHTALQTAFEPYDELDAKAVVAHVGKMAGVQACAIMFGDGLSLAGNLPAVFQADGLCAMAPSLLQKVENHMGETKLGALRAMTLSCEQASVTFLMQNNLCLAALHSNEELAADVREGLTRAVHELSKKYSNPA